MAKPGCDDVGEGRAILLKHVQLGLIVSLAAAVRWRRSVPGCGLHRATQPEANVGMRVAARKNPTCSRNTAAPCRPTAATPSTPAVPGELIPDHYWSPPDISVYSVPAIPVPHPRLTLKDLGDRAQVRAIDAIEKASSSPLLPWQNLRPALSDADEPAGKGPLPVRARPRDICCERNGMGAGRPHGLDEGVRQSDQLQLRGLNIASTENGKP